MCELTMIIAELEERIKNQAKMIEEADNESNRLAESRDSYQALVNNLWLDLRLCDTDPESTCFNSNNTEHYKRRLKSINEIVSNGLSKIAI